MVMTMTFCVPLLRVTIALGRKNRRGTDMGPLHKYMARQPDGEEKPHATSSVSPGTPYSCVTEYERLGHTAKPHKVTLQLPNKGLFRKPQKGTFTL